MNAELRKSLDILFKLEFSNPKNALHKNKGENGLTYKGVYQSAHPKWEGWNIIEESLYKNDDDVKNTSLELHDNIILDNLVVEFYEKQFWNRAKLSEINSQKKADEIFIFGVNAGMRNAVRKTQKLVGVDADGIIGSKSIKAINKYDEDLFDMQFDEIELQYYDDIIERKPSFAMFRNGWKNRALAV